MNLRRKAIRVGIAASLCMLVSKLLNLKFPFFVLLPAVMPISTYFGETIKFGINRIVGSSIGALIGVIFVTIQSQNIFLIGIGVILIIYICNYLKWDSTTSIACLVFVSIMVSVQESSALLYSVHRLLDTFIGIAITTIVNNYIFNPDMTRLLKNQAINIQKNLLNIANSKDFIESKNELENIQCQINSMREKFKIYTEEFKFNPKLSLTISELENIIYTITIVFEQIKIINYINTKGKSFSHDIHLEPNSIDTIIHFHKNIFFMEMNNLNKIIDDIT